MPPYDFYLQWISDSNPWREAYNDVGGNLLVDKTFLLLLALFSGLNIAGVVFGKIFGPPLSMRPTVLAGSFHAAATSVISIYLLLSHALAEERLDPDNDEDAGLHSVDWFLWQKVAVPLSLAYFTADAFFYCLPKSDTLILFHHFVMCLCHYPIINDRGAILAGCGNADWAIWLSMIGYTSEISTVLMNYRWYLIQTLEENRRIFAVVNILVVLSWCYRIILFAYLLLFEILPKSVLFVESKQILTYAAVVAGHAVIGYLSLYWLRLMCRGGMRSLLTFKKREKKQAFAFGDDIGRGEAKHEEKSDATSNNIRRILQQVLDEARGWVDGTLFQGKENAKKE